jgi:hypothetical protein
MQLLLVRVALGHILKDSRHEEMSRFETLADYSPYQRPPHTPVHQVQNLFLDINEHMCNTFKE